MRIAPKSVVLLTGDSITDCGRAYPTGTRETGLGGGYVAMIDALMGSAMPSHPLRIVNTGISGNTVRDLAGRWEADVLRHKPDWLSVMIGVNDVWRQFDSDPSVVRPVGIDEFTETYERLLRAARSVVRGVVLLTPFCVTPNRAEPMRAMVERYAGAVKELAARDGAVLVDTQAVFDGLLEHWPMAELAPDMVHPTGIGHMALARAWLQSVGFAWQ